MTRDEAWAAARDRCGAWNRRDLDAVMAHYADDAALCSLTIVRRFGLPDGWLHGRERLRENFAIGIQAPGLRFEPVDVLLGAGAMTEVYRRESGALATDSIDLDGAGKALRVVACYGEARPG